MADINAQSLKMPGQGYYEEEINMATKTLSIRMNDDSYKELFSLAREERIDVSKVVRDLVELGRIMLAINKYKASEASIEKAAKIAGVSVSKMIDIFIEFSVEANLDHEDYLKGLETLRGAW